LGEGGDPIDLVTDLLQPANPSILSHDLTTYVRLDLKYFSNIHSLYTVVRNTMKMHGALIIEAFKIFPDMIAEDHEVTFGGDFNLKTQFGTDQNVNHTMLVVGARLTGLETDDMGGMEFLVQNSCKNKPFLIIGYDLLRSMGVKKLYAIENGLKNMLECGSPSKTLQFEDSDNSRDRRWGLSNEPLGSKKQEEELPSYWMKIDPKKIAYILT
jgi:hypothetical protein